MDETAGDEDGADDAACDAVDRYRSLGSRAGRGGHGGGLKDVIDS